MNYKKAIYTYGYIATEPMEVKKRSPRIKVKVDRTIDICLNCTRKKCTGSCELIKRKKKERKNGK